MRTDEEVGQNVRSGAAGLAISKDTDVTAAIGRRFRQLVRPPRPGTDERDLLI
jgi:hypothetical protein